MQCSDGYWLGLHISQLHESAPFPEEKTSMDGNYQYMNMHLNVDIYVTVNCGNQALPGMP